MVVQTGATMAAQQAMQAQALKANGVFVTVESEDFLDILRKMDAPLIVTSSKGVFSTQHCYLTSYKGLAFYTKSPEPLPFPERAEVIPSKSISIPGG